MTTLHRGPRLVSDALLAQQAADDLREQQEREFQRRESLRFWAQVVLFLGAAAGLMAWVKGWIA